MAIDSTANTVRVELISLSELAAIDEESDPTRNSAERAGPAVANKPAITETTVSLPMLCEMRITTHFFKVHGHIKFAPQQLRVNNASAVKAC